MSLAAEQVSKIAPSLRLIQTVWNGLDPYDGFPAGLYAADLQGWNSTHHYLREAIETLRPSLVVEIGVWKGASTITMAHAMRELGVDGCVLAIDTWLGSWDHWVKKDLFQGLHFINGHTQLLTTFMQNVLTSGVKDWVVPLPLDSVNAFEVVKRRKLLPDCIHIDAGHDYRAVMTDLEMWWSVLRPGGILIGDDYITTGGWPDVYRAFNDFFRPLGVTIEHAPYKCRIAKPL